MADAMSHAELPQALLSARETGDRAALGRLRDHYGREITADEVRARVWQGLESYRRCRRLTLEDAALLLAREAGFSNWSAFLEAAAAGRTKPPGEPYAVDRETSAIRPRRLLSDAEWDALIDMMRQRRIEALHGAGHVTDAVLERISRLDHVTRLDLGGCNQLGDDGLRSLARMPQLRELDLSNYPGGPITDRGLEVLRSLKELRRFELCWQPNVSDAGVAHLAACDSLESVNLMGTHTGDGALRALAGKPTLRSLRTGRQVSDAGLPLLHDFPVFKAWRGGEARFSLMGPEVEPNQLMLDGPFSDEGVKGLDGVFGLSFFWHCPNLTSAGLDPLRRLSNLGHLSCNGELCDDAGLARIAAIPKLRMLGAQGAVASDAGFESLSSSATLEYLWGRECPNLTGRGFAALSLRRQRSRAAVPGGVAAPARGRSPRPAEPHARGDGRVSGARTRRLLLTRAA
jgi:hypothetical protein